MDFGIGVPSCVRVGVRGREQGSVLIFGIIFVKWEMKYID
jgi:hypothetical protein